MQRLRTGWRGWRSNSRPIIRPWRRAPGDWSICSAKSESDSPGPNDRVEHSLSDAIDHRRIRGRTARKHCEAAMAGHGHDHSAVALLVELRRSGPALMHQHHHGDRARFGLYDQMRHTVPPESATTRIADDARVGGHSHVRIPQHILQRDARHGYIGAPPGLRLLLHVRHDIGSEASI